MREYDTWSFRDRSFVFALAMSILWHLFWFLSVKITVNFDKNQKVETRIVSLSPALTDTLLKELVETKPIASETFYRRESDFLSALDMEAKSVAPHAPGEVVSVPFGKRFWSSLKEIVGGTKTAPGDQLSSKMQETDLGENYLIMGEIKDRQVISRPPEPAKPLSLSQAAELEFLFSVEASGVVSDIKILASSGNAQLDLIWGAYLNKWQFAPLEIDPARPAQNGRVKFYFSPEKEL